MKNYSSNATVRQHIIHRIVEVVVIVFLAIGVIYFYNSVVKIRSDNLISLRQYEQAPTELLHQADVKNKLREYSNEINQITALVPTNEGVGDFISLLEKEAKARDIVINIPEVTEESQRNELNEIVPWTGPFKVIRFSISGRGNHLNLLKWLHTIENTPYLVRIISWKVETVQQKSSPNFIAPVAPGASGDDKTQAPASLQAHILLTILNDG